MVKAFALLVAITLSGCASQPQVSLPPSEQEPAVMAPEPDASSAAMDLAMFAERFRQAVAVVVSGLLMPDYKDAE